ncbi:MULTISPECIES: hypothetical protein [unclassified Stenotrophomonas]|uniref:hypothetical protein n=1 Tax=unclassified Stenotrophomonas TaxID=196198 RepID=UPI00244C3968|nr:MULTISPECIES: hypothetical protein [unclassified Stenotrophomonas]MDG9843068.1 DUF4198 domain-containing protein [Stenotrophomonas sp. GD04054]MDH0015892.1 DUF4198 domain-containing protein [Stenotrophomonas sp. GD04028]MDH0575676.1 DUF4198 domain-containing protein [Stenotrophomonas sp. GD03997]MDH0859596.1 DUF4198 domain-containing protein [Stenotrophomonas sp. GD03882]
MHIFKMLIALSLFIAASAIAEPNKENLALIKQLAIQPIALVDGDLCHIRGAVWLDEPIANVEVEILDGSRIWKTKTNSNGIYSISIPFEGNDKALLERPASLPIPANASQVNILKPTFLCSQSTTTNIMAKPKGAN